MPAFFKAENSALATASLSVSRWKGLAKTGGSRVCDKMVARRRSCKTIRGEEIRKLREEVRDALRGREEVGMVRRGWWR